MLSKPRPTLRYLHSCASAYRTACYREIEDRDSWLNSDQHLLSKIADGSTQIPDKRKKRTS